MLGETRETTPSLQTTSEGSDGSQWLLLVLESYKHTLLLAPDFSPMAPIYFHRMSLLYANQVAPSFSLERRSLTGTEFGRRALGGL